MDDVKKTAEDIDVETASAAAAMDALSDATQTPVTAKTVASGVSTPLPPEEIERLNSDIIAALKTVYDPEIPADIYELGLIYKVDVADDRSVAVEMTLTAPACPVAGEMPIWVENAVNTVPGVAGTTVKLVFDPPWDQSRMSDEARLAIGMF